jgi:phosphatidylglycerol:prolipoprotein diacylglycerol transferase
MIRDAALAHLTHYAFEWLALAAGAGVYSGLRKRKGDLTPLHGPRYALLLGCILGAAIGNKALFWLEYSHLLHDALRTPALFLQGQSIVGGLLGGWLGVEIAKWLTNWSGPRTGDDFVPAILVGILVGRIGCFLAGLHDGTYGLPTALPWGVDLGDGITRHPAPLYEWLAALIALLTWPRWSSALAHTPGLSFRTFILGYLLWRLLIDGVKPVPYAYAFNWSGIQWACMMALVLISTGLVIDSRRHVR